MSLCGDECRSRTSSWRAIVSSAMWPTQAPRKTPNSTSTVPTVVFCQSCWRRLLTSVFVCRDIFSILDSLPYVNAPDGRKVDLPSSRFIGLYFGANHCGACAKFSSELQEFLHRMVKSTAVEGKEELTVLFVSSDSSEQQMESFLNNKDFYWFNFKLFPV